MPEQAINNLQSNRFLYGFAIAVGVLILTMIVAGGLVTSQDAGDSVPDWPLSYGSVYPAQQMVGNVRYEHTHRMIGWALGLMVIALAAGLQFVEKRRAVRRMGWIALFWVCLLGGLGGLRVMLISKPAVQDAMMNAFAVFGVHSVQTARVVVTVIHTALAQSFLCFVAVLAVTLSRRWINAQQPIRSTQSAALRRLAFITVAMILLQLIFGAIRRHTDATLPLVLHLIGAGLVLLHVALLFMRVRVDFAAVEPLMKAARWLMILTGSQIVLGLLSWWIVRANRPGGSFLPQLLGSDVLASCVLTAHLAVGALIFVAAVLTTVFAFRHTTPAAKEEAIDNASIRTSNTMTATS